MEESQPTRWFSILAVLRRIGFGGDSDANKNQSLNKSRGGEEKGGENKVEDQQVHNKHTNASIEKNNATNEKSTGPQEAAKGPQVHPKKQVRITQLSLRGNKREGSQGIWKQKPSAQIQLLPDRIAQLVEEEKRKKRAERELKKKAIDQTENKGSGQTEKKNYGQTGGENKENGASERTVQVDRAEVERVFGSPKSPPAPKKRVSDKRIGDHRVRVLDHMLRVYPSSSEDEMAVEVIDESEGKEGTIEGLKSSEPSEESAQLKCSELNDESAKLKSSEPSDNCARKAAKRILIASMIAPPEEEVAETCETIQTTGPTEKTECTEKAETSEKAETNETNEATEDTHKAEITIEISEKITETKTTESTVNTKTVTVESTATTETAATATTETTEVANTETSGTTSEKTAFSDIPTLAPARPTTSLTKRNKKRKDGNKRKRARTSRGLNKVKTSLDIPKATEPLSYNRQTENNRVDPHDFDISETLTVPLVDSSPQRARDSTRRRRRLAPLAPDSI